MPSEVILRGFLVFYPYLHTLLSPEYNVL